MNPIITVPHIQGFFRNGLDKEALPADGGRKRNITKQKPISEQPKEAQPSLLPDAISAAIRLTWVKGFPFGLPVRSAFLFSQIRSPCPPVCATSWPVSPCSPSRDLILAIENGTQSGVRCFSTPCGTLLAKARCAAGTALSLRAARLGRAASRASIGCAVSRLPVPFPGGRDGRPGRCARAAGGRQPHRHSAAPSSTSIAWPSCPSGDALAGSAPDVWPQALRGSRAWRSRAAADGPRRSPISRPRPRRTGSGRSSPTSGSRPTSTSSSPVILPTG